VLGSSIRLTSRQGDGAVFSLDLPIALDPEAIALPLPAPICASVVAEGLRVLVIDDEPEIRTSLKMMLEAMRWEVLTASGLADALVGIAAGFVPQAMVVDHRLSGHQTGIELIRDLARAGCQAPAVIVTGDTGPAHLALFRESGLPVLHKPVSGERLVAAILAQVQRGEPS